MSPPIFLSLLNIRVRTFFSLFPFHLSFLSNSHRLAATDHTKTNNRVYSKQITKKSSSLKLHDFLCRWDLLFVFFDWEEVTEPEPPVPQTSAVCTALEVEVEEALVIRTPEHDDIRPLHTSSCPEYIVLKNFHSAENH